MSSKAQILIKHTISYAEKTIDVFLEQSSRKTFSIEVSPDMRILVKAPKNIQQEQILDKIEKRKLRIYKQIRYFEELYPKLKEHKYIS